MDVKVLVPDMHCEHCVNRIEKLFQTEKIPFSVSLEDKTVTVRGEDALIKKAVEGLEDLGFSPRIVE